MEFDCRGHSRTSRRDIHYKNGTLVSVPYSVRDCLAESMKRTHLAEFSSTTSAQKIRRDFFGARVPREGVYFVYITDRGIRCYGERLPDFQARRVRRKLGEISLEQGFLGRACTLCT